MDPVENIKWMNVDLLKANHYNPNRVMNAEMALIEKSILKTGWIQPILINKDNIIIDGFHRWTLSRLSPALQQRYNRTVPCCVLDVSEVEAMIITVRINRAKGTHLAFRMADYVKEIINKHGYPMEQLANDIGGTIDEVKLLMRNNVFAAKDIENYTYSEAWVPAESGRTRLPTPADIVDGKEVIRNKKDIPKPLSNVPENQRILQLEQDTDTQ